MTATEPLLANGTETSNSQNHYGSNEKTEPSASSFVSLIETKTKMKAVFLSSINKLVGEGAPKSKTLLEKAKTYREENPDAWEKKCEENKKKERELNEIYMPDPFLESYYQQIDEVIKEEQRKKELEKLEPAKLILRLLFNLPQEKTEENSEQLECYKNLSSNVCIFDRDDSIFDVFKSDKNEERGSEPELIITAKKTKYLQNHLEEGQKKYTSSRLKCCLYGDNGKRKEKHLTDYIYCTRKGKSVWSQTYVLKGYKQEELKNHYVVFKITAKSEDDTDTIGEPIIGGEAATIHEHSTTRTPTSEECIAWQKAIENPGEPVDLVIDIFAETAEKRTSMKSNDSDKETKESDSEKHKDEESPKHEKEKTTPKKKSGLRRILPKMKSQERIPSNNQESSKSNHKNPFKRTKSIDEKESGAKTKNKDQNEHPHVKNLMTRMLFFGETKVEEDKTNKLPPSSNMKVSKTVPEDLSLAKDEENSKITVFADEKNKLPPSSNIKISKTIPEDLSEMKETNKRPPSGKKKDSKHKSEPEMSQVAE